MTRNPAAPYLLFSPWTHGKLRMQLIHMDVQISNSSTLPFNSARVSGLELSHNTGDAEVNSGIIAPVSDRSCPCRAAS